MLVRRNSFGVEATVEEISVSFVSLVEVSRVRRQEPLHSAPEVPRWSTDQQMEVRVEDAVGKARPPMTLDRAPNVCQQFVAIVLISHDRLAATPLRDDVLESSRYVLSWSPRHAAMIASSARRSRVGRLGQCLFRAPRGQTRRLTPGVPA